MPLWLRANGYSYTSGFPPYAEMSLLQTYLFGGTSSRLVDDQILIPSSPLLAGTNTIRHTAFHSGRT